MAISYIEAIDCNWPLVQCHSSGPLYTDLVYDSGNAIPTQAELDAWITSNPFGISAHSNIMNAVANTTSKQLSLNKLYLSTNI